MPKKTQGLLKQARKKYNIKPKELDNFIEAKATSTKYYIENTFETNKFFRYLLLLRIKGCSIDNLIDKHIKQSKKKTSKP